MIWFAIIGAVLIAGFFLLKRSSRSARIPDTKFQSQKTLATTLPTDEQAILASDIRELAFTGYDRVSSVALNDGRNAGFANEAGILDAVMCVLANENSQRQNDQIRRAMQMEGLPFNTLDPSVARPAVAEYLVWKFFPPQADMPLLEKSISNFVDDLFERSKADDDPFDAVAGLVYTNKYDWQKLAIAEIKKRTEKAHA